MSKIKLVLTDIDGTLVPSGQHEVSARNVGAVAAARAAGVYIVPVTGRPIEMARPVLDAIGHKGLCIVDGGASIRDAETGELVWSRWLGVKTLRQVVETVLPYCDLIDYDPAQYMRELVEVDVAAIRRRAPYVFGSMLDMHDEAAIKAALATVAPDVVMHLMSHKDGPHRRTLQVTHKRADKQHGVAALLRRVKVAPEEILAIGDADNDLPLFEQAGIRVAVGNATDRLRAAADYIAAPVEVNGFAEAVERFVISAGVATSI